MRFALALSATLLLSTACKSRANQDVEDLPSVDRVTETALDEEGLIMQEIDLDADGRPDVENVYRERGNNGRVHVQKKLDLNLDGKYDVISTFDDSGALETEKMDSDFDGVYDWTDHYKSGSRVMTEQDTNFDGRTDIWYYYTDGPDGRPRIDRKTRDTSGDGRVDHWERFDDEGNVMRTGRDTDGDGKMDERDQ
jgi:hypothetical protein